MNPSTKISLFIFVSFILVSLVLPLYSFDGYSVLTHTTSHLGAQGSPNSWMMNLVFILLGGMSIWHTYQSGVRYHQVIGAVFGLSLIMTAIFQHAPLIDSIQANQLQDLMHSIFADLTGFSFTILAIGHGFISRGLQRSAGFIMAFVAVAISIGMMVFPEIMGLLQRVMFISAFSWLFFYMKAPANRQVNRNPY